MSTSTPQKRLGSTAVLPSWQPTARRRLVWKEFRQNMPLTIVFVVVMGLTLTVSKIVAESHPSNPGHGLAFWFRIIWTYTNIFALAVGVFIFSPEKENRTDQFLSILPIRSGFPVRTKLWMGMLTIAMFAAIGLLFHLFEVFVIGSRFDTSIQMETQFPPAWIPFLQFGVGLALLLECFFWGAICSLFTGRAIVAAVLATVCFTLFSWALPMMCGMSLSGIPTWRPAFAGFLVGKFLVYLGMGFALIRLGKNWLGDVSRLGENNGTSGFEAGRAMRLVARIGKRLTRPPLTPRIYSSLIWQSFRQFRLIFVYEVIGAAALFLGFLLISALVNDFKIEPESLILSLIVPVVIVPLIGSMFVFFVDHQDQNYRFFQQHREFGRKLWFARLLPAGLLTLVSASLLAILIMVFSNLTWGSSAFNWLPYGCAAVLATVSVFAIGQFNSMFFRSGVFAVASALLMSIASLLVLVWLAFLGAAWIPFFAPIPLALLAVTWWRAPQWLADGNRFGNIVLTCLTLALVTVVLLAAFAIVRVQSVPPAQLLESSIAMARVNALKGETALIDSEDSERSRLLIEASNSIVNLEEISSAYDLRMAIGPVQDFAAQFDLENAEPVKRFLNNNQKSLQLLQQADLEPPSNVPLDDDSQSRRIEQVSRVSLLYCARAWNAQAEGDLEAALRHWIQFVRFTNEYDPDSSNPLFCLLRWSELPGQSPELIKKAIQASDVTLSQWVAQSEILIRLYALDFENWYAGIKSGRSVSAAPVGIEFNYGSSDRSPNNTVGNLIPWEMERSKRLIYHSLTSLFWERSNLGFLIADPSSQAKTPVYESATGFPKQLRSELFSIQESTHWGDYWMTIKSIQTRRYIQVRMALNAWKIEHGEFPKRLVDLEPEYFDDLPVDVGTRNNFGYSATGLDARIATSELRKGSQWEADDTRLVDDIDVQTMIDPGTPFLLPWAFSGRPKLVKCSVNGQPDIEPFDCYAYRNSDWQLYIVDQNFPFELEPQKESGN